MPAFAGASFTYDETGPMYGSALSSRPQDREPSLNLVPELAARGDISLSCSSLTGSGRAPLRERFEVLR